MDSALRQNIIPENIIPEYFLATCVYHVYTKKLILCSKQTMITVKSEIWLNLKRRQNVVNDGLLVYFLINLNIIHTLFS